MERRTRTADHGRVGRNVHPGHALGLVAAFLVAPLVAGCGRSVADEPTVLRHPVGVTVAHRGGIEEPGRDGVALARGDTVRTDARGRAELVTRGRVVYLGSDAVLAVTDGAHQQVRRGAALVDASRGPRLQLAVSDFVVAVPARAAVRVERGFATRVGALLGTTRVRSDVGRQLDVSALHQVLAVGDALPDATGPLRLTDDAAEQQVVPALVADDRRLQAAADGIDGTPAGDVVRVVTAAFTGSLPQVPRDTRPSERVLPAAIAVAGGVPAASAYDLRVQGASWGVVVHLLGTDARAALAALARLESAVSVTSIGGAGGVLLAAGGGTVPSGSGGGTGAAGSGAVGSGGVGSPGGGAAGGGGGDTGGGGTGTGPTPSPTATPGTTGGVVGTVVDTVGGVVDTVTGLLPSPSPTPSPPGGATQAPLLPVPTISLGLG